MCRTFQKVRLFDSMTVAENIRVAASQCVPPGRDLRDEVAAILAQLRLEAQATRRPSELTLADRKRVEIGRAIAGHCRLLMLDESMSGLTHEEAEHLIAEILALNRTRGITVIVVEHVLSVLAAMVKRLVVLHNATVVADGTPTEIAHDPVGDRGLSRHQAERAAMTLLAVENLSVSYGDLFAVREVSFALEQDAVFVLLGANGAGKTSILRAISGLVPARGGSIMAAGQEPDRPAAASGRARGHLPRPGRAAHLFPSDGRGESGRQLSCRPGAGRRWPTRLPRSTSCFPRLAERRRQAGGTLSGGEQQMLAIGRAMMNFPKLLMLDEPSLGLSPVLAELVFERLVEIRRQGTTILLVEQNATCLEMATSGIILANGRVVLAGDRARARGFGFRPPRLSGRCEADVEPTMKQRKHGRKAMKITRRAGLKGLMAGAAAVALPGIGRSQQGGHRDRSAQFADRRARRARHARGLGPADRSRPDQPRGRHQVARRRQAQAHPRRHHVGKSRPRRRASRGA